MSIKSSSQLKISFTPLISGQLILDSLLSVNGSNYQARGMLHVLPGPADPGKTLVTGPGAGRSQAQLPASFFVEVKDSYGNPAVSQPALLTRLAWTLLNSN